MEPIGIVRVLERMNDCDAYPIDDDIRVCTEINALNRIDQEWGCDKIVGWCRWSGNEYCGMPEHDPFTSRCYHHGVSGHLPGGSI